MNKCSNTSSKRKKTKDLKTNESRYEAWLGSYKSMMEIPAGLDQIQTSDFVLNTTHMLHITFNNQPTLKEFFSPSTCESTEQNPCLLLTEFLKGLYRVRFVFLTVPVVMVGCNRIFDQLIAFHEQNFSRPASQRGSFYFSIPFYCISQSQILTLALIRYNLA